METLSTPRILIAGTGSGVGKSLLTAGIVYQLRKRNLSPSCCVIGPCLGQASFLRRVSGRYVRCLDEKLLSAGQSLVALHQAGMGADLILLEGHGGLYDGAEAGSLRGSDAEIAALTRTPTVLVIDAAPFGAGVAAVFKGYASLADGFEVVGAILNRVAKAGQEPRPERDFYAECFGGFNLPPPLGAVPEAQLEGAMPSNVISQRSNLTLLPRQFLLDVETLVERYVDIERLVALGGKAPPVSFNEYESAPVGRRSRIAVSDDSCFNMCFQDNLDLLRYYGAELVTFSPLADTALPRNIGALYLTGACLAEYGRELSLNVSMKDAILDFAGNGGVIYSEGGGTAFLCRDYKCSLEGTKEEGIGIIPASAVPGDGLMSYLEAVTVEESVLGRAGLLLKSVSSGEWRLVNEERMVKTMRLSRSKTDPAPSFEGYSPGAQMVCTFSFVHFGSNPAVARNLVEAAQVVESL